MHSSQKEKAPLLPMKYGSTENTENSMTSYIKGIYNAHAQGDINESKRFHDLKNGAITTSDEHHSEGLEFLKAAVYGGLDGIITTFATVTSVAGSGLPNAVILILGISHLLADGFSMGVGDTLSTQAENELSDNERRREKWEFENYPQGELSEMIEIYEKKGVSKEDATLVVNTLAKYKDAFIDVMMVEELGILPESGSRPVLSGTITFASFCLFGCIPLLCYIINLFPGVNIPSETMLIVSSILVFVTLFILGAAKGMLVGQPWWKAGLTMTLTGGLAALAGWVAGYLLKQAGIEKVVASKM